MYASLARRLSNSSDIHKILEIFKELKQKFRDRIPSFEEFEAYCFRKMFVLKEFLV